MEGSLFHKKSSRQNWIMFQVAEPNIFTCSLQDVVKFMVSVTRPGCHLHEPRQEAACVHPLRDRQEVEKFLSPHAFLQPSLKLIMLHKAVLRSYSLASGALGGQSGHWSGLLLLLFLFIFLFQSQTRLPLLLPLDHSTAAKRLVQHLPQARDYKSPAWAGHL